MTEPSSDVFCLQSGSQQQQDCQIEQLWILTQKASWTLSLMDPKMARCNDEEVGPTFWFHYSGLHLHSICLLITQFISLAFELKQWALPPNDLSDHSSSSNNKKPALWCPKSKRLCGMTLALFWGSCLFYYSNVRIRTDDWNRWDQAGKLQLQKQARAKFKWAFLNAHIKPAKLYSHILQTTRLLIIRVYFCRVTGRNKLRTGHQSNTGHTLILRCYLGSQS